MRRVNGRKPGSTRAANCSLPMSGSSAGSGMRLPYAAACRSASSSVMHSGGVGESLRERVELRAEEGQTLCRGLVGVDHEAECRERGLRDIERALPGIYR